MLHLVIMAGGSGTRFWPESRRAKPKQFLTLTGERTLLQQAADRCRPWIPPARTHVVTNAAHAGETLRQLPDVPDANVLLEPCGRNTAPCIALAAWQVYQADPEAVLLVTPADHLIRPEAEFRATVERAVALLEEHPQSSILFGIQPAYPATGYGYIERGGPAPGGHGAWLVQRFREKPTQEAARSFLATGNFYWNSGIFVWRAARILELIEEFQPEIHARFKRLAEHLGTPRWAQALMAEFPRMPSISIDYAVLEPVAARQSEASSVYVVPASFAWDDVGSWQALPNVLGTDGEGNTIAGPQCGIETRGCIIRSSPDHLIATIGLENFVVVHTPDATLIAPKEDETALRKLVSLLEERGYGKFL